MAASVVRLQRSVMRPRELCIYCGHLRPPETPGVACARCGRTAEDVRWWPRHSGRGSLSRGVIFVVLTIAMLGVVASAVALVESAPLITYAWITLAALLIASPLLRALTLKSHGTWCFASKSGDHIGLAMWDGARLMWAYGVEVRSPRVEVPEYAREITASTARAAGVRALGPGVCLAMKLDAEDYDDRFNERALAPMIAAALVGMAARENLSLWWQRGWNRSFVTGAEPAAYRRLVLASGVAPTEAQRFERSLLEVVTEAEAKQSATWRATERDEAHYRAQAQSPEVRFCALDDLASSLSSSSLRDRIDESQGADASSAERAALAFRAFAASHPEVVERLVDTFIDA